MKKLFGLIIALIVFIPAITLADEEAYEYFDFRFDRIDGEIIKNTDITIYASVASDENNLIDRTDEFNVEEIMWSVCTSQDCSTVEEVADDAAFEADKDYLFMIRITAKNEADIDVWGTDKASLNGTPIEMLDGEYGNTGKELMIKSKTISPKQGLDELSEPPVVVDSKDDTKTTGSENETCIFGLSLCCTMILGLSLCIWIIIAILVIILLLVIICGIKCKKRKQEPFV